MGGEGCTARGIRTRCSVCRRTRSTPTARIESATTLFATRAALLSHTIVFLCQPHPRCSRALRRRAPPTGRLLQEQGDLDAALPLAQEVEITSRSLLGPKHPDTLVAMSNLAQILTVSGKTHEALPFARQALEGMRETLGSQAPHTLVALSNLAQALASSGRLEVPPGLEPGSLIALPHGHTATLPLTTSPPLHSPRAGGRAPYA